MNQSAIADWLAGLPEEKLASEYPLFFSFKAALHARKKKEGPSAQPPGGIADAALR